MNQTVKLFVVLSGIALLLAGSSFREAASQAIAIQEPIPGGEFRWTPRANGFAGKYNF